MGGARCGTPVHPLHWTRDWRRAPILVSLAALPGWAGPLWVMGLFIVLELFTNLVLETGLYAGATGISQVALLVSVAFWTWLWGPLVCSWRHR